jgi:hypothetical protein
LTSGWCPVNLIGRAKAKAILHPEFKYLILPQVVLEKLLLGRTKMASHLRSLLLAALVLASAGITWAQSPAVSDPVTGDVPKLPFPYIAEVTGTGVYIRAGAGTTFYETGKINAPARVTVTGELYGWSKIIPPEGSFSWVAKEYVEVSPDMPGVGIIKGGDGVRVWAGSDYVEPMRSYQQQVQLNDGDMVRLISGYYKIVPPPGAYLWISSRFLKPIQPLPKPVIPVIEALKPEVKPEPAADLPKVNVVVKPDPTAASTAPAQATVTVTATNPDRTSTVITPDKIETSRPAVNPASPVSPAPASPATADAAVTTPKPEVTVEVTVAGAEAKRIQECYDIMEKINAELQKPLLDQKYDEYKNARAAIQNDPAAGKAQRYAEYQLQQIARFELAQQASHEVTKRDSELQKIRAQIRQEFKEKLAEIPNPGKYIIKGTLQPSLVFTGEFGKKRYKVLDDNGKILCYARCADGVISIYADRYVGRKVGLKGTIVSDPSTPVGLVTFTAIEELTDEQTTATKTASNTK